MRKKMSVPLAAISGQTTKKPDISNDVLDAIADKVSYGKNSNTKSEHATNNDNVAAETFERQGSELESSDSNVVIVNGQRLEKYKEILVSDSIVTKIFHGNKRNQKKLRNIEDLARSIIPDGHNTEPVKLRPLADGSGLELVKGIRRLHAVRAANELTSNTVMLRAIVSDIDDNEAAREAAMENSHRDDITPWELAEQLKFLLDHGVVPTVEGLIPYLPSSKKEPTRALVYYHLEPAKVPAEVRAYVDESIEMKPFDARKFNNLFKDIQGSEAGFYSKLKAECFHESHGIKEITEKLKDYIAPENRKEKRVTEFKDDSGKLLVTVTENTNGTASIKLSKEVPMDIRSDLFDWLESRVK